MKPQFASCSSRLHHCRHSETADPGWQRALPAKWRTAVVAPVRFSTHSEDDMPASRSFGYDELGKTCYYHHAFLLDTLRSDDDEDFYEAVVYAEEVHAWRMRDERWLTWRIEGQGGDCKGNRGVYAFSERMPR